MWYALKRKMAQSKSQKHFKGTPVLRRLVNFVLIFFLVSGGFFLFYSRKEDLNEAERKKIEIFSLIEVKEIIEDDYRWEIITKDNLKIIIDPNQDIKKQINLVKQVLSEIKEKDLEYIGVDVNGQVYLKVK